MKTLTVILEATIEKKFQISEEQQDFTKIDQRQMQCTKQGRKEGNRIQ